MLRIICWASAVLPPELYPSWQSEVLLGSLCLLPKGWYPPWGCTIDGQTIPGSILWRFCPGRWQSSSLEKLWGLNRETSTFVVVLVVHDLSNHMTIQFGVLVGMLLFFDVLDTFSSFFCFPDSLFAFGSVFNFASQHGIPLLIHHLEKRIITLSFNTLFQPSKSIIKDHYHIWLISSRIDKLGLHIPFIFFIPLLKKLVIVLSRIECRSPSWVFVILNLYYFLPYYQYLPFFSSIMILSPSIVTPSMSESTFTSTSSSRW